MAQAVRVRRSRLSWMVFPLLLLGACSTCATRPATGGPQFLQLRDDGLLALSRDYYVVRALPGDTYMGLAWEHNVSPYEVISLNQVKAPYRLRPGQRVRIPTPRVHVVRRGDTLSNIATAYHVDFYDLAQANALNKPFTIFPGQVLRLPSRRPVFKRGRKIPVRASFRRSRPSRPGLPFRSAFPTKMPDEIPVLKPEPKPEAVPPRPRPKPALGEAAIAGTHSGDGAEITVAALPLPRPKPGGSRAANVDSLPEMAAMTESAAAGSVPELIWPVRGPVISRFGPTENGRRNDGINIAVPEQTPVQAAADGIVIYCGNEVAGFGNLILIRHSKNLVTAYAHTSRFKVKKGERVGKGQVIALSGSTGNVDEPQLHFEVRRGVEAVDPIGLLSA